jgi:hypothetical protein
LKKDHRYWADADATTKLLLRTETTKTSSNANTNTRVSCRKTGFCLDNLKTRRFDLIPGAGRGVLQAVTAIPNSIVALVPVPITKREAMDMSRPWAPKEAFSTKPNRSNNLC